MRLAILLPALCLGLATAGCSDDSLDILGPEDVTFAPELGVDLDQMTRLPTGVYIQTLEPGTGSRTVLASDSVEINYTLWLPDGTLIDQGQVREPVAVFILGFQDGLLDMTTGETRLMVLPPERAWGANPPPGIPLHSVVVFEVELLEIPTIE